MSFWYLTMSFWYLTMSFWYPIMSFLDIGLTMPENGFYFYEGQNVR